MTLSERLKNFIELLLKPVGKQLYLYLLFVNLLSNFTTLLVLDDAISIVRIIVLSALTSYIETGLYLMLKPQWLRRAYAVIVIAVSDILLLVEYFLLTNFHMIIGKTVFDIIVETTPRETSGFMSTYINPSTLLLWIGLLIAVNALILLAVRLISRVRYQGVALVVSMLGILTLCSSFYTFIRYRQTQCITQLTTFARLGTSLVNVRMRMNEDAKITEVCKNLTVKQNIKRKPTVVVVIGESFSVYHSQLYGYAKPTEPLLEKRRDNHELYVFDNAVTVFPITDLVMTADFSLDSLKVGYTELPLFPACFRKAGYRTELFDNQYFVNNGVYFLSNKELSKALFDVRNTDEYTYDGQMVDDVKVDGSPSLYVIHLIGQHYDYADRYPANFRRFTENDYDKSRFNLHQRRMIADYDNATLYNDYVVDKIIKKFQNQYCVVVYFSDHGEEVYELRNYMGHGNADSSPNPNYQIRVPLMVWLSPSYKAANPSMDNVLKCAEHYPICLDDIGNTLLDFAGITCSGYAPTRSFINSRFNRNRHRIVMNYIDYDKELINKR